MKYTNIILLPVILFFLWSCGQEENIKEIDIYENDNKLTNEDTTDNAKLYVAISTMISPIETFNLYKDLIDYISEKMDVPIIFKQRKTYGEVNFLLKEKKLDFAFICTGAYVNEKNELPVELLVVPVVNGRALYNAYIIVNKQSDINSFEELKGKSFAFTDPLSNSGYAYVVNLLKRKKTNPDKFFNKTIYTNAHDYSIQAVARNFVDGATIDGLVYDFLEKTQPEKVKKIKIIKKSEDYGIPPFVVRKDLDPIIKNKLKEIMLNLHNEPRGKGILKKIHIDKFIEGNDELYQ
ncbi:MAG: phosphate/phosphite/phosphonate ABC transporter substrate-binding protein [Melioribacter sp.]|uniref:substrate-binding domain-containing protein n=1 Tax=Melioribacter sp. TaxID=2052167 RepID=UPI003BB9CC0C